MYDTIKKRVMLETTKEEHMSKYDDFDLDLIKSGQNGEPSPNCLIGSNITDFSVCLDCTWPCITKSCTDSCDYTKAACSTPDTTCGTGCQITVR